MSSRTAMLLVSTLGAAGCEQDLVADHPDAGADTLTLPAELDWSCIDTPWPNTAPDPLSIEGSVGIADATIEVHAVADDALLAQGTSGATASTMGKYAIDIATGGAAADIYRKATKAGYGDIYAYEAFPADRVQFLNTPFGDPIFRDPSWVNVWGEHPDPTKGAITMDIFDCNVPPAETHAVADATVDAPPGARVLYIPEDFIIRDEAKLLTSTTAAGRVYIERLPPGTYDIPIHIGGYTYRSRPVKVYADATTVSPRHP